MGEQVKSTIPGGGDTALSDSTTYLRTWSQAVNNLAYTASLTMIGLPCEVMINTVIKIVPLIYGVQHFSAGYYVVTGVTDEISQNGYTTQISLMRLPYNDKDFNLYNVNNGSRSVSVKSKNNINSNRFRPSNYVAVEQLK